MRIEKGVVRQVKLETITRMPMLEEGEAIPFRGIRGVVRSSNGAPVAGLHVFAYEKPEMTGNPAYFSNATGADGTFELNLPGAGPYYILARENFGGPAVDGEQYGKYRGSPEHAVRLEGNQVPEIEINVELVSDK